MSLTDDTHPASPADPAPLPVRVRERRPAAADAEPCDEEPFQGCALFPLTGTNARGRPYVEAFQKHKLTESSIPDLGLRIRLVSPSSDEDGTTRPTFNIPLLPIDTTVEAIQDRWGPGCYEVSLCRRSLNDRTKAEILTRRVRIAPRPGGDFGPSGEYDVGREPWPLDLSAEDGQVTDAMREEIAYRSEVRERRGDYEHRGQAEARGGDRPTSPYESPPPYPPPGPVGAYPPPEAPKPGMVDALVSQFSADPVGTATKMATAAAALREVFAQLMPKAPPPPTAQEIAAATTAALAQALGPLTQALASKAAGPDAAEIVRLQLDAMKAQSDRQLAEVRAALDAQRLQSEQSFKLALAQQEHRARMQELQHQLELSRNASEQEKGSILAELNELRKRLQSGDGEEPPSGIERFAMLLDTEAAKAAAPHVAPAIGRLIDSLAGGVAPAPPPPPALFSPPPDAAPAGGAETP